MTNIEKVLASAAVILVLLKFLSMPGAAMLLIMILSLLALFYFALGFAIFNGVGFREIFKEESFKKSSALKVIGAICTGFVLSVTIIGIIFKLFSWPGAHIILIMGVVGMMIITVVAALKHSKIKLKYYSRIFQRIAVFGFIALFLLLLPRSIWIDFQYQNSPQYRDALKESLANPENEALSKKRDLEFRKMKEGNQNSRTE